MTPPGCSRSSARLTPPSSLPIDEVKRAMAHVSWKSHENGAMNPTAHMRKPDPDRADLAAPMIAYPLGTFRLLRSQRRRRLRDRHDARDRREVMGNRDLVTIKALQLAPSNGVEMRGTELGRQRHAHHAPAAETRAYHEAGITDPRKADEPDGSPRLLLDHRVRAMEDLAFSAPGIAPCTTSSHGRYDRDGRRALPARRRAQVLRAPDRRIRPADGLRNLPAAARPRRRAATARTSLGLTHNLGGVPNRNVASVAILGLHRGRT